jgi:hypothetical protein
VFGLLSRQKVFAILKSPIGAESFGIGRHFYCQILAAPAAPCRLPCDRMWNEKYLEIFQKAGRIIFVMICFHPIHNILKLPENSISKLNCQIYMSRLELDPE